MRNPIRFFTEAYEGGSIDHYRKARTLSILVLLFIVLILCYLLFFFAFTGSVSDDSLYLLLLSFCLCIILLLVKYSHLSLAALLTLVLFFIVFSILIFSTPNRDVLRVHSLAYLYMFIILLSGLIGTESYQSILTGVAALLALSWFFFSELLPASRTSWVISIDYYLPAMFILGGGTVLSFYHNQQLGRAFRDLYSLNNSLESTVAKRTDQLSRAVEDLRYSKSKLVEAEKLAALGSLVGGVSHEINTPLGNCLTANSYGQRSLENLLSNFEKGVVSRTEFERRVRDVIESQVIVDRNLNTAITLLQRFKSIAVEQGYERRQHFLIRSEIDNVMDANRNSINNLKHLSINVEGDPELEFLGYPDSIWQILTNFLQNSLMHGINGDTGRIDIRYSIRSIGGQDNLVLLFEDDGVGMTREVRDRIFEPFFTTRRERGGAGLGLNIVYNIVQRLGGSMHCISNPEMGARFVVNLPLMVEISDGIEEIT